MTNDKHQNGKSSGVTIKSSKELDLMRESGRIVAETKAFLSELIRPGLTTAELDRIAENEIRKKGGVPSFKGYMGFPATICSSFNYEIVHGIPSNRRMNEGDLISIDIGAIVGGFHSDTAFTAGVGVITKKAQCLIEATQEALRLGIAQVKPGARIGDISSAIQEYSENLGYSVVRQYVGHGIGRSLHEDPQVPNYGSAGKGPILREGMAIAIEPMLNLGSWKTETMSDGWTVVTADRQLSAHFEDTVAITSAGVEVFTSMNVVEARV